MTCLGLLPAGAPTSPARLRCLGFPALSAGRLQRDVIHGEVLNPLQDEAGFK